MTATPTAAASGTPAAISTVTVTPTAVAPLPSNGTSFRVGQWTVIAGRTTVRITSLTGAYVRSSPVVRSDNRVGSVPVGAIVTVEGRVQDGGEAEPGKGTTWYFVGMVGGAPQFIYAAPDVAIPVSGR